MLAPQRIPVARYRSSSVRAVGVDVRLSVRRDHRRTDDLDAGRIRRIELRESAALSGRDLDDVDDPGRRREARDVQRAAVGRPAQGHLSRLEPRDRVGARRARRGRWRSGRPGRERRSTAVGRDRLRRRWSTPSGLMARGGPPARSTDVETRPAAGLAAREENPLSVRKPVRPPAGQIPDVDRPGLARPRSARARTAGVPESSASAPIGRRGRIRRPRRRQCARRETRRAAGCRRRAARDSAR